MTDADSPETATILVVDDEEGVRRLASLALQRAGYIVIEASGGGEALAILEAQPGVSLLLLDCKMPVMSGPELARTVQDRWPDIKLLAMSGEQRSPDMPPEAAFIAKPFRPSTLVPYVESVLRA